MVTFTTEAKVSYAKFMVYYHSQTIIYLENIYSWQLLVFFQHFNFKNVTFDYNYMGAFGIPKQLDVFWMCPQCVNLIPNSDVYGVLRLIYFSGIAQRTIVGNFGIEDVSRMRLNNSFKSNFWSHCIFNSTSDEVTLNYNYWCLNKSLFQWFSGVVFHWE